MTKRIAIALIAGGLLLVVFVFPSHWLLMMFSGLLLLGWSYAAPPATHDSLNSPEIYLAMNNDEEQTTVNTALPAMWDERHISRTMQQLSGNQNALQHYIDQIFVRFVDRQNSHTSDTRIEFIKKQNALLAQGIENIRLNHQARRTQAEEALKDAEVGSVRVAKLRQEMEEEELLTKIEEQRFKREGIRKEPVVAAPPQTARPQVKTRKDIESAMDGIYKENAAFDADPNLRPEDKVWRKNANQDRLEKLKREWGDAR
jgi:hypothetical protein